MLRWAGKGATDAGVTLLAASCPHLASLEIHACDELTDNSLAALLARCPALRLVAPDPEVADG